MEFLLSRFRNLTVLLVVLLAQLLLLAYQVKSNADVPMIRVWAVTAVTPAARVLETLRGGTVGFAKDYIFLRDLREENQKLKEEVSRLKLRTQFLTTELETADRVRALSEFRAHTQSKTIAARVIMSGTGVDSQAVFLDRGSSSGVVRGMAVITADGIVGKIVNSYPMASQVLLATDPTFAAGVVSQKNRVHGTLKGGIGRNTCIVDHVQNEETVEVGEWFYTSGDDRVFPKGLPAGQVRSVKSGKALKEIVVTPSALQNGVEEVLIVLEGVHQSVPDPKTAPSSETYVMPPPPPDPAEKQEAAPAAGTPGVPGAKVAPKVNTEADRMLERYQKLGESQGHVYGGVGSRTPDFNGVPRQAVPKTASPETGATSPAVSPDEEDGERVRIPETSVRPPQNTPAPRETRPADTPPAAGAGTSGAPSTSMTEFSDRLLLDGPRKSRTSHFRAYVVILIPLAAILFQVYVPKFIPSLSYLEFPLLVTVYFALMRRQPIAGCFIGAAIGLVQDSLSHEPLGMFGIVKTLAGYFAASVSQRFDVENVALRFFLSLFFFVFHQFFYWVIARALLAQNVDFDPYQAVIFGLLNAVVSLPLFAVLDKLKETA